MNADPTDPQQFVADALEREIARHESGQFTSLGLEYDAVEAAVLPFYAEAKQSLDLAFRFWDGWVDASNHSWQYYSGIQEQDWPRLASTVVTALRTHQQPSDPRLLASFGSRSPSPLRRLFSRIFGAA